MLFHVSEDAGISTFEPRPSEYTTDPVVWAVDDERLRNYLLPRDCPRVTYYAGPQTTAADRERFLGPASAVVAVEEGWLERIRRTPLDRYHLPSQTFECIDECAGYFVSPVPVAPTSVGLITDPIPELVARRVDFRTSAEPVESPGRGRRFQPSVLDHPDAQCSTSVATRTRKH